MASQIVYLLRNKGCDNEAFSTTIALMEKCRFCPMVILETRLNQRHAYPGFGGFYLGYAADMTAVRLLLVKPCPIFNLDQQLLEAQKLGVSLVKAGAACRDIDTAVRNCLKDYGLEEYFQHGTGHSLGLEIHEAPAISSRSDAVLEENMVVTVEPGVYIAGWGGIRIEDTVIVKNGGCEVITHSDKNLLII